MARSAVLTVQILTDASQASKGAKEAAGIYDRFAGGVDKLVKPAAVVTTAVTAIGVAAASSASRTEQAMGALDSVFGKNAATVKGWADTAAESVGLARSQYGELASVIGAQLNNLGLSTADALSGTQDLISLGADLAATFGGTTADAVGALSAALRGEADPAERYGLALSKTAVSAYLAEQGLDGLEGAALKTAQTQAILDMATQQAGGALGQFARESDTAAGAQQRAAAQWENAVSTLGTALLPVVVAVSGAVSEFSRWVSENSELVLTLGTIAAVAGGSILVLAGALKVVKGVMIAWSAATKIAAAVQLAWSAAVGGAQIATYLQGGALVAYKAIMLAQAAASKIVTAAQWAWNAALSANPIGIIIVAVVALVAAFVWLWNNVEGFRNFFTAVFNAVRAVVQAVVTWFQNVWRGAVDGVTAVIRTLQGIFTSVFNAIMVPIDAVSNAFSTVVGWIKQVISWLGRIKIPDVFGAIGGLFGGGRAAPATAAAFAAAAHVPTATVARAPRLGAAAVPGLVSNGGGVVINVYGGLDSADATARRVQQLLTGRERRTGGVVLKRRTT